MAPREGKKGDSYGARWEGGWVRGEAGGGGRSDMEL